MSPTPETPVAFVVEDDETIGQLLNFMLEREGYKVELARDGREAREFILTKSPPRFALFDVMLPFVDGFELVRIARAQAGWEQLPIVMLTAKTQERDIVRALDEGATDYILKPFQPNELLARLRRFTRTKP